MRKLDLNHVVIGFLLIVSFLACMAIVAMSARMDSMESKVNTVIAK